MTPVRSSFLATIDGRTLRPIGLAAIAALALAGCEQNTYVPPPPPKVDFANPVQRPITRYLEATGNTAAIKSVDLVARVQGFLDSINYKDGSFVKEGTTLFTIEPQTYKLKLDQAQAAQAGSEASLKQAEADFKRQVDLVAAAGGLAGDARYLHLHARQRAGRSAAGAGRHQDRRSQLRLHQGGRAVRRHRHRASGLGRRTRRRHLRRRSLRASWRSTRSM